MKQFCEYCEKEFSPLPGDDGMCGGCASELMLQFEEQEKALKKAKSLFNLSEIALRVKLNRSTLKAKVNRTNYNRCSSELIEKIKKVLLSGVDDFIKELEK